jgi:hypothetical protein
MTAVRGDVGGLNLAEEIRRVFGVSLKGRYRRYKAKKWRWVGNSGVVTSTGQGTWEVFCADFEDKFESPYTFSVAVDIAAGVIFPVDDLPETQRHAVEDWLDTAPGAEPLPPPPSQPSVQRPSGPRKQPSVSLEEAIRGIYIDFEGTLKDPASLVGVLVRNDSGELEFDQPVFEEDLWPAVREASPTKPGGYAVREAAFSDTFHELRQRAERESRRVFAYGHREIVEIRKRLPEETHVAWWNEHLSNMLPLARRWTEKHHRDLKSEKMPKGGSGQHSLSSLLKLIDYDVPKSLGPGNSARRLREVRNMLNKHGGNFAVLSGTKRGMWTRACRHNWHDCEGMRELMIRIAEDVP